MNSLFDGCVVCPNASDARFVIESVDLTHYHREGLPVAREAYGERLPVCYVKLAALILPATH